jgi:CheY-like chemotaxis protein
MLARANSKFMNETHIKALHRAAQIKGGINRLASHLAVPEQSLLLWMDAKAAVPAAVFLKVVDLLLAAEMSGVNAAEAATQPRILVVDDDLGGTYSLARVIKQMGHAVETATSGAAALEMARRLRPDLIFLDLRMPDMDGVTVAERLRAEGLEAQIVAATAYGSDEDRRRTASAGFKAHLLKPVDPKSLQGLLPPRS